MISCFLEILNEEVKRRSNKRALLERSEITLYLYRLNDKITTLDREYTQCDETEIQQKEFIEKMKDYQFYIIKSNSYAINILFDEIFQMPKITLTISDILNFEEADKNIQDELSNNQDFQKLISNDSKYEDVLFNLKKCYFIENHNYENINHVILLNNQQNIKDQFSKKKVIKYGKTNKISILRKQYDESPSINSHTSVISELKAVAERKYDFKNKYKPYQQVGNYSLPTKKQFKEGQKSRSIPVAYQNENKSESSNSYSNKWETKLISKQLTSKQAYQEEEQSYDQEEEEEDYQIQQLNESDINFQKIRNKYLDENAKKEKLKSMIPKNLRSDKTQKVYKKANNQEDELNCTKDELRQINKKRNFKRGKKQGYQDVDQQKQKKKKQFPNREYFIISDVENEDDDEQEYIRIKSLVKNQHLQLPQNPNPPQIIVKKLEEKLENEKKEEYIQSD